ncbi:MAG: hypothetical protein AABX88_02345 [Nanoarchaeota archaeon]
MMAGSDILKAENLEVTSRRQQGTTPNIHISQLNQKNKKDG